MTMRVLLADYQLKVRSALRLLLEHEAGVSVIGEVTHSNQLLTIVKHTCPDVLLLDWELPNQPILNVLHNLRRHCPSVKIIVLSGHPEAKQEALEAGVDQFISKAEPATSFLLSFRAITSHQPVPA
jgi:DNA-binding NarL/FixJ family response regulator